MERMERIAFIGLGIMGSPMAKRLLAAGYPVTVWNRTASRAESLQAEGADVAASPAEAVREADVVITMLADPTAVREVIDGIARHLRPGTTLIEASTIGPQALEEVAALLPGSVALIDAPVMGSADRAASGQLVVLAGGNLTKVRPILEVFGTVTECGAVGHGAALKVVLINAVIAGVTVVGEAMALADALGLPEELVTGALANGPLAGIAGRAFAQGANYPLRLAAKDVTLATAAADLPLLRTVHDQLIAFPEAGSEDLSQIVRHLPAPRQAQPGAGTAPSPRLWRGAGLPPGPARPRPSPPSGPAPAVAVSRVSSTPPAIGGRRAIPSGIRAPRAGTIRPASGAQTAIVTAIGSRYSPAASGLNPRTSCRYKVLRNRNPPIAANAAT